MLKESTKRNRIYSSRKRKLLFDKALSSPQLTSLLSFCIGALVSGASYNGACTLAGVAFVGALGSGVQAFAGFVGVISGYLFFYGFDQTALYIGAALFAFTIAFLFQYTPLIHSKWFMPLNVFFLIALIRAYGAVHVVRGSAEQISEYALEAAIGGALTYIFSFSLRHRKFDDCDDVYMYSVYSIIAAILTGFPSLHTIEDLAISSVSALMLTMSVLHRERLQSYPIAAMFGFALQFGDTAREGAIALYLLYSTADMLPLKKNKLLLSLYFLTITCIHNLHYGFSNAILIRLCEVLTASLVFWCIPNRDCGFENKSKSAKEGNLIQNKAMNIRRLSHYIQGIAEDFHTDELAAVNPPNMNYIFDCALEEVCSDCEKKKICWEMQSADFVSLLHRTAKHIKKRGRLEAEDFPNSFRLHCIRCHSMVLAVNYELRKWHLSERMLELERMNTNAMKRQNLIFAQMLDSLSNQLAECELIGEPHYRKYSAEIGMAGKRKNGETVCGDSVKYFKTTDGMLYVILSDGAGCGEEAERFSNYVVTLMEEGLKLLREPISVIEYVRLSMRSLGWWAAATIDMAAIDLNTGSFSFYKLGACESYIVSADKITTIEGNSDSVGLQSEMVDVRPIMIDTESDSIIVLASDGAALNMTESVMQCIMENRNNMKRAARQILLCTENEISDDKTVITIAVKQNTV